MVKITWNTMTQKLHIHPKFVENYSKIARCLKITEKVAFNTTSEASYVYVLSGQKWIKKAKKMVHFGEFLKTWSLQSNSVTRQVSFNRTKIVEKCHNSKATFWVDKSSLKKPKMVNFGKVLKTWSLQSNSVTRQVTLNRTKIGGKCQNWKYQMRHFGWFSNNVRNPNFNSFISSGVSLYSLVIKN